MGSPESELEAIFEKYDGKAELSKRLDAFLRSQKEVGKPVHAKKLYQGIDKAITKAFDSGEAKPNSLHTCVKILAQITTSSSCNEAIGLFIQQGMPTLVFQVFNRVLQLNIEETERCSILETILETITAIGDFSDEGKSCVEKFVPLCIELVGNEKRTFPVRLEATKFLNDVVETFIQNGGQFSRPIASMTLVKNFGGLLSRAGDMELQLCLTELIFRMVPREVRNTLVQHWFSSYADVKSDFLSIRDSEFEGDCRKFVNCLNRKLKNRSVYSVPCKEVWLGTFKVQCPTEEDEDWFWTDFNLGSKSISFFACNQENDNWETVVIRRKNVVSTKFEEKKAVHQIILIIKLNLCAHTLLTFCPESKASFVKLVYDENNSPATAAKVVFVRQPVVPKRPTLSPDVISSTPPKASVSINAVHLSSRSKGLSRTVPVTTAKHNKQDQAANNSASRKNAPDDSGVADLDTTDKGGAGDTVGPSGKDNDSLDNVRTSNMSKTEDHVNDAAAVDGIKEMLEESGVVNNAGDLGDNVDIGGQDMKNLDDERNGNDSKVSDRVEVSEMSQDLAEREGDLQDNVDEVGNIGDLESQDDKMVIQETQDISESTRDYESIVDQQDKVGKGVDNGGYIGQKAGLLEDQRDIIETEHYEETSVADEDTSKMTRERTTKGRLPRGKTATKKGKAKSLVSSTSESERSDRTGKTKGKKRDTETTKNVTRPRTRNQKNVLGSGYNTEDWVFGESDVERRKAKHKAVQESLRKGNGRLSQSRQCLIDSVFRENFKTTGKRPAKYLGPFEFRCSPVPKRTKHGLRILRPASRTYQKRKEIEAIILSAGGKKGKLEKSLVAGNEDDMVPDSIHSDTTAMSFSDLVIEKARMKITKKKKAYSESELLNSFDRKMKLRNRQMRESEERAQEKSEESASKAREQNETFTGKTQERNRGFVNDNQEGSETPARTSRQRDQEPARKKGKRDGKAASEMRERDETAARKIEERNEESGLEVEENEELSRKIGEQNRKSTINIENGQDSPARAGKGKERSRRKSRERSVSRDAEDSDRSLVQEKKSCDEKIGEDAHETGIQIIKSRPVAHESRELDVVTNFSEADEFDLTQNWLDEQSNADLTSEVIAELEKDGVSAADQETTLDDAYRQFIDRFIGDPENLNVYEDAQDKQGQKSRDLGDAVLPKKSGNKRANGNRGTLRDNDGQSDVEEHKRRRGIKSGNEDLVRYRRSLGGNEEHKGTDEKNDRTFQATETGYRQAINGEDLKSDAEIKLRGKAGGKGKEYERFTEVNQEQLKVWEQQNDNDALVISSDDEEDDQQTKIKSKKPDVSEKNEKAKSLYGNKSQSRAAVKEKSDQTGALRSPRNLKKYGENSESEKEDEGESKVRRSPRLREKQQQKKLVRAHENSENNEAMDELDRLSEDDSNMMDDFRNCFAKIIEESRRDVDASRVRTPGPSRSKNVCASRTQAAATSKRTETSTKSKQKFSKNNRNLLAHWEDEDDGSTDPGRRNDGNNPSPRRKGHFSTEADPFKFDVRTPKVDGSHTGDSGFYDKTPGSSSQKRTLGTRARTPGRKRTDSGEDTPGWITKKSRRYRSLDVKSVSSPFREGYRSNEERKSFGYRQQETEDSQEEQLNYSYSQPTSCTISRPGTFESKKRKMRDEDIGHVSGPFSTYPERRRKKQAVGHDQDDDNEQEDQDMDHRIRFETPEEDTLRPLNPRKLFHIGDRSSLAKRKKAVAKESSEDGDELDEDKDTEFDEDISIGDEVQMTLASLGQDMKNTIKKRQDYVKQMANSSIKFIVTKSNEIWSRNFAKRDALINEYAKRVTKYIQDHQEITVQKQEAEDKILSQLEKHLETVCSHRAEQEKCLRNIIKTQKSFTEAFKSLEDDSKSQQENLQSSLRKEMLRYRDQVVKELQKQEIGNIKRRIRAMIGSSL